MTSPVKGMTRDYTVRRESAGPGGGPLAAEVASVTRGAYTGSDPLPGLPPPDGAFETAGQVGEELAAGCLLWTARDAGGRAIGALRVTVEPAGGWEVRRIAILPAWRGRRLLHAMVRAVDEEAAGHGVPELSLNAVVERCLPPIYQRLGFQPRHLFQARDKPLTEWRMARRTGAPFEAVSGLPRTGPGLFLCWLVTGGELLADVRHATGAGAALRQVSGEFTVGTVLVGIDHLPDGTVSGAERVLRSLPPNSGRIGETAYACGRARTDVPFHLLPRSFVPELMSLSRYAPGRERPIGAFRPDQNGETTE